MANALRGHLLRGITALGLLCTIWWMTPVELASAGTVPSVHDEAQQHLLNLGFTHAEIQEMPPAIRDQLNPLRGKVVASDSSSNDWIRLTTTVSAISKDEIFVKTSFTWLTDPYWTLTDAVGADHDHYTVVVPDSEKLVYTYDDYTVMPLNTYVGTKSVIYTGKDGQALDSGVLTYDLLGRDGSYVVKHNRGYMYYIAHKTPDNFVGYQSSFGRYVHQQKMWMPYIGIDLPHGVHLGVHLIDDTDWVQSVAAQFYIGPQAITKWSE